MKKKKKIVVLLAFLLIFSQITFAQIMGVDEIVIHNKCYGDSLGAITLVPKNYYGIVKVFWENGETSLTIDSLPRGFYSYKIVDDFYPNDTIRRVLEIKQPDKISFWVKYSDEPNCYNGSDGSTQLVLNGGTGQDYFISGSTSLGVQKLEYNEFVLTNLYAGCNKFVIKDQVGCISSDSIRLGNRFPGPLAAQVEVANASCDTCSDGSIRLVAVSNGDHPWRLYYNGFIEEMDAITTGITGLKPGTYSYEVKAGDPYCILWMTSIVGSDQFIDTTATDLIPVGFDGISTLFDLQTPKGTPISMFDPDFQVEIYRIYKNGSLVRIEVNEFPWDKSFNGKSIVGPCLVTCSYKSNNKQRYFKKVVHFLETN